MSKPGPDGYAMKHKNVAGGPLSLFEKSTPLGAVGYFRDGYCRVTEEDKGNHSVAATVTQEFLDFTDEKGNNLGKTGVQANMPWCLCAHRWKEAMQAAQNGELAQEAVPKVHLHASDQAALSTVTYRELKRYENEQQGGSGSGRQGSHHNPESSRGVAKDSQEIGGGPTLAPGMGKSGQGNTGDLNGSGRKG